MAKSNGIKDLKQAAKLLNKHAPDGESLAYINPGEARLLKAHGGSGIETLSGVPSYNWFTDAVGWVVDKGSDVIEWGADLIDSRYGGDEGLKNLGTDALSVWTGLKAKKDQEGLNAHEMEQFNKLNQQLAAAEKEFAVNVAGGPAVTNVPDSITDVASYTDVTLPAMKTTAVAEGGRIGFDAGGNYEAKIKELMARGLSRDLAEALVLSGISEDNYEVMDKAKGGRIGYNLGGIGAMDPRIGYNIAGPVISKEQDAMIKDMLNKNMDTDTISTLTGVTADQINMIIQQIQEAQSGLEQSGALEEIINLNKAQGGRIGAKEGGIMPLLNLGGMEKDYRQDGGFVPIGRREKADDVPARLSKNEFVFTADAVRNAGGGDIDKGAQRMYNVMKNLEAGGEISEQSQGQV